jgi:hypothetical protein
MNKFRRSSLLEFWYGEWNVRFFGGRLPNIPIGYGNLCKRNENAVTYIEKDGPKRIVFNSQEKKFSHNMMFLFPLLLHEMIHVKQWRTGWCNPKHCHERSYRRELKRIALSAWIVLMEGKF